MSSMPIETPTRGVVEAGVHQLVGEDHRLLQAERAIAGVDQREIAFLVMSG
jgi:hypothetical protein